MRKIREALRLRSDGFSGRQVAQSLGVGRATISEYFRRAGVEGLSWPLPADLSDSDLERRLFSYAPGEVRHDVPQPDWAYVHAELRRKGVTLSLLWEEYRGVHPAGYGYSRYCELYTRWEGKLSPVMRQRHPAGERLFVDYAGPTVDVVCPKTGEVRTAQIFVATLGASSYTYVEGRLAGRRNYQTGYPVMCAPLRSSTACLHSWFRTISRLVLPRLVFTILRSIAPMGIWRHITTRPSFRRGRENPRTKQRLRALFCWRNVGYWPACAISIFLALMM